MVGSPCGQHGSYVFHKAFSFSSGGRRRALALGEFFFVRPWRDEEVVCVCELQLLYQDRSDGDLLACVRLYLLPEHTPDGRLDTHGEVSPRRHHACAARHQPDTIIKQSDTFFKVIFYVFFTLILFYKVSSTWQFLLTILYR